MRVAILDKAGRLVGSRQTDDPSPNDIEYGDLPQDGTYKWVSKDSRFVPVNFGFGKPRRPGVDRDRAIYLALAALIDGRPIPQDVRTWCDWYKQNHEVK